MSRQHPDRDSLAVYLEGALSIDATQWVEQHLEGCAECRDTLRQERVLLERLNSLSSVEVPADFTHGVMARVAQHPAYQPAPEVQWRRLGLWVASAAALVFVLFGFVGWALIQNAPAEGSAVPVEVTTGVGRAIGGGLELAKKAWGTIEAGGRLLPIVGTVSFWIFDRFRQQALSVQLALLLITVGLNYWFTRLVLNYQRRH